MLLEISVSKSEREKTAEKRRGGAMKIRENEISSKNSANISLYALLDFLAVTEI